MSHSKPCQYGLMLLLLPKISALFPARRVSGPNGESATLRTIQQLLFFLLNQLLSAFSPSLLADFVECRLPETVSPSVRKNLLVAGILVDN